MSFLESLAAIFGTDDNVESDFGWQSVSSEVSLSEIIMASNHKPQVIYKHSTRCATSFFALKNVQSLSEEVKEKADFYMVDVISQRGLSAHIAEQVGVRHESPQLIILKEEKVFWNGSHHSVNIESLETNI
ncbi:MAG: bacillithiol system redox-active protein YtxJ [Gracilimonas sp.]